jgi:alpha-1,6-mannosyltransferase
VARRSPSLPVDECSGALSVDRGGRRRAPWPAGLDSDEVAGTGGVGAFRRKSKGDSQARSAAEGRHPLRQVPLSVAGATGFVGSLCVLVGVAQSGSPFTSKLPDAWFFGVGAGTSGAGQDGTYLGVIIVYLGVVLMVASWFEVVRTLRRNPATPVRTVSAIAVAWAIPVLVMPPLFSRDVYSYAAQGEMVSRGLNPYVQGPTALGPNPYLRLVDPIWRSAHAPYGPAWERLAGGIVQLARHDVVASIVGFRLVALVGVGLIAWGVPVLARSIGRDPAPALALAVLNPLVLLVLLGGAHNDALMLGLLVAGCALARRNHILVGLALCALAAEVKVPALIGALFIGWWWSDGAASWRRRASRIAGAVLIAVALMVVIGVASGLGWHWLDGLSNPGVVVSWVDPVTAVGLALSHASSGLGLGGHSGAYVQATRAIGVVVAAVISVGLVLRSRVVPLQALGWSLLAFVVLGPVVWPWYETWGFVFLAVVAEAWTLWLLLALSAIACFADLPSVRYYQTTDPVLAIVCWVLLAAMIIAYGVVRIAPSVQDSRSDVDPSTLGATSE